jgi:hypothetical protein
MFGTVQLINQHGVTSHKTDENLFFWVVMQRVVAIPYDSLSVPSSGVNILYP